MEDLEGIFIWLRRYSLSDLKLKGKTEERGGGLTLIFFYGCRVNINLFIEIEIPRFMEYAVEDSALQQVVEDTVAWHWCSGPKPKPNHDIR